MHIRWICMKNRICMKQLSAVIIQHPGNHVQNLNEKLACQADFAHDFRVAKARLPARRDSSRASGHRHPGVLNRYSYLRNAGTCPARMRRIVSPPSTEVRTEG